MHMAPCCNRGMLIRSSQVQRNPYIERHEIRVKTTMSHVEVPYHYSLTKRDRSLPLAVNVRVFMDKQLENMMESSLGVMRVSTSK